MAKRLCHFMRRFVYKKILYIKMLYRLLGQKEYMADINVMVAGVSNED